MEVSRSGYYKWRNAVPSQQELKKQREMERIRYHFNDSEKRYGSPKIITKLDEEGVSTHKRTVGIYMKEMGLRSCVMLSFRVTTTDSNHNHSSGQAPAKPPRYGKKLRMLSLITGEPGVCRYEYKANT